MDLSVARCCPCRPDFIYKNDNTFKAHRSSKTHKTWEIEKENKDTRLMAKDFENQIERLKSKLAHKEDVEKQLLARIKYLESLVGIPF